jgi:hypothetical protein
MLVDAVLPGVEPDRLFQRGQRLTGRIQPGGMFRAFTPDPLTDDPAQRIHGAYSAGDVVLARIGRVAARAAQAWLHPKVPVEVLADDDEPDLRNLVAVDDVVTLTLLPSAEGAFTAELADANAPSVPCVPVLPGGPPWLVEADLPAPSPAPSEGAEEEADAAPDDTATAAPTDARATGDRAAGGLAREALSTASIGLHAKITALQAQVSDLGKRLQQERVEAGRQADAAGRARDEAKRLRRQLRSLKDQHEAYRARQAGEHLFGDPEQQLRYEVEQAWLRRLPEPERDRWPVTPYRLGPDFLASLESLEGITRDKVVDVLVEVLTDRAKEINGRELHPLRVSEASQEQRVREDGARAWRCALQIHTPSARRLHFWRLVDGSIELDRVGTHDQGL